MVSIERHLARYPNIVVEQVFNKALGIYGFDCVLLTQLLPCNELYVRNDRRYVTSVKILNIERKDTNTHDQVIVTMKVFDEEENFLIFTHDSLYNLDLNITSDLHEREWFDKFIDRIGENNMTTLKERLSELKEMLDDYEFNNDVTFLDYQDVAYILREVDDEPVIIEYINDNFFGDEIEMDMEDIKKVFINLKERVHNPKGKFDKQGRWYANDSDIVSCRSPSVKYPYSEMNHARTSKFLKELSKKYRCKSLDDLEIVAYQ